MTENPKPSGAVVQAGAAPKRSLFRFVRPALTAFGLFTIVAAVVAYKFGEGVLYINDRTISDLSLFEVTGGAAVGVLGLFTAIASAALGLVATFAAGLVGIGFGTLGIVAGTIIAIGVVTGPLLLLGLIVWAVKRHYWPDII